MRRPLAWSSLVVVAALFGCGSSNSDDLFTEGKFGVVTGGGSTSLGGTPGSGGSLSGGRGGATGVGGTAGATGGVLGVGGSSLGGAAGKGGGGGSAGKGGATGKTCPELLSALPSLQSAAQACSAGMNPPACNGFVKNQCGCMVAVNDTASNPAKSYTEAVAALLSQCGVNCADVVCATVTMAECVSSGSGSATTCLGR